MTGTDLVSTLTIRDHMIIEFVKTILSNANLQVGSDPVMISQLAALAADAVLASEE